jgi:hypothetical protein
MRPTAWVTLLVFVVFALGVRAHSVRAAGKSTQKAAPVTAAPFSCVVEGKWMAKQEDAVQSALEAAQSKLSAYLRNTDPQMVWTPDVDYISKHLWKDIDEPEKTEDTRSFSPVWRNGHAVLEEERDFRGNVGVMRRVRLKVAVSPEDLAAIKRLDNEYQQKQREAVSHQRQLALARGLAVAVVLLLTLVGYFRLEEATKGYYTTWLRFGAAGLVAAVVLGLLLVA